MAYRDFVSCGNLQITTHFVVVNLFRQSQSLLFNNLKQLTRHNLLYTSKHCLFCIFNYGEKNYLN